MNKDQRLTFTAECDNDDVEYEWEITNAQNYYPYGDTVVVNGVVDGKYTVTVRVIATYTGVTQELQGTASVVIEVNTPPSGGECFAESVVEAFSEVPLSCSGW